MLINLYGILHPLWEGLKRFLQPIISKDNVYGVQFHPEKSREAGLQIIKNFTEIN
jgi:imidazoleglycerol phosphate synthase glutamine amidotransferase subunit HisH